MTRIEYLPELPPSFKGDIILRDHPNYQEAIRRWARSAERRAAIVAYIKGSADAAIALAYARQHGLPIAIKGGGHSSAGASSVEDGLVIDCSRYMNYCYVDAESKTARVGGGATWEMVDIAAYKHGLSTVGGVSGRGASPLDCSADLVLPRRLMMYVLSVLSFAMMPYSFGLLSKTGVAG